MEDARFGNETQQQGRYLGKVPLLCRADGCQCWAQTGTRGVGNDPDAPGLCLYHSAIEDSPEAWRKMTELLQSAPVRGLLYLCSQLEKLPIDRDERTKMDGTLRDAGEWRGRRWVDSDYLTAKTKEWIEKYSDFFRFEPGVKQRHVGAAKNGHEFWEDKAHESPKAYGIRVHHALVEKLIEWSMPKNRPAAKNVPDPAMLKAFFERNKKVFKEAA